MDLSFLSGLFKAKSPPLIGCDISSSAIKIVEISETAKNVYRIERYAIEALPRDAVADGNIQNLDAVADALKRAWKRTGTNVKNLAMALPTAAVITKKVIVPAGQQEENLEIQVETEANQYIPFALEEVNLDFQVIGPAPNSPDDVEVLIAASRKEKVEDRVAAAEAAGLKALVMDVDSYATQTAFELIQRQLPDGGKDQNVAIVDVGTAMMNVNVLRNGQSIYMREQPFGGNQLTQEIQNKYGLSAEEAEAAKRAGGLPETYESEVLQPFMETLALEVARAVQFFFASTQFNQVHHIMLAGGCATIPGVDEIVNRRTQVNTMIANPFTNMAMSTKIRPRQLTADAPSLMVEGRIVIDLANNNSGIDLKQQGRRLVIDLLQTSLPKSLERRLNVVDFATPVQTVEATSMGENTRIVVEPRGLWEHSAYQTDNRFILEVKPVTEDPNKLVQGNRGGYSGEKLSLNFQNVEVRAVLQVIADFTGLNIITSDTVAGNLTLRLKDVPWDQALDIILQSKGLDLRKNGNVVWIAPRDELATKEKLALEAQQQIADLEPTRTESFQLNYQRVEALTRLLTDPVQRILSKRGSAVIDPRTNTLFIQDTAARLDDVRKLLAKIDVAVRQVMIEARIVEASDSFSRNLGARLGFTDFTAFRGLGPQGERPSPTGADATRLTFGGSIRSTGVTSGQSANYNESFFPDSLSVNLPAANINGAAPGQFSFLLFNDKGTKFLNLELSALQADSKGKIISSPRVITADKIEATIEQGTEIPYQQATSSGATSVSFKKATLSLKVKPQITPEDKVIMTLNVHKDSPGATTTAGPAIDTKQVTTEVLVDNGGTVVIGGIYQQTESNTTNKVPVLGDLPYVGFLFKQNLKIDNKNELLIFITPRIIKDTLTLR